MNEQEKTASADTTVDTTPKRPWTPGPWVADDNEGYGQWTIWEGRSPTGYLPPGRMIAKVIGECCQAEADARLIAAAPTQHEALDNAPRRQDFDTVEEFLEAHEHWFTGQRQEAISLALGGNNG